MTRNGGAAPLVTPNVVTTPRLSAAVATTSKTARSYRERRGSAPAAVVKVVVFTRVTLPAGGAQCTGSSVHAAAVACIMSMHAS